MSRKGIKREAICVKGGGEQEKKDKEAKKKESNDFQYILRGQPSKVREFYDANLKNKRLNDDDKKNLR